MITTLLAAIAMFPAVPADEFTCAVQGTPAPMKTANALDYNGVRYPFCCGGCPSAFANGPSKFVEKAAEGKAAIGYFLFDPVSGAKIDLKKLPELSTLRGGTRYYFLSEENKKAFDADEKLMEKQPGQEVLFCSVMGHETNGYAGAGAFADHEGVRYYFCCTDCLGQFKKEPAKFAEGVKAKVQVPKALKPAAGS